MSDARRHYIPAFTRSVIAHGQTVLEQAACGTYVAWDEVAPAETEPTCAGCRQYVGLDAEADIPRKVNA